MIMKERMKKKDAGTIFNPVMYLMVLFLTVQLLMLFVEYKRVAWVSGAVTDTMTDALLTRVPTHITVMLYEMQYLR